MKTIHEILNAIESKASITDEERQFLVNATRGYLKALNKSYARIWELQSKLYLESRGKYAYPN